MTSIKVRFRPSADPGKEGTIYYQIIHRRVIRQQKTDYRIHSHEWNEKRNAIVLAANSRNSYLQSVEKRIKQDVRQLESIVSRLESRQPDFTADDIVTGFRTIVGKPSLFRFMGGIIAQLKEMERHRTSEAYYATLRSFAQFRGNEDIALADIDSDLMLMYEAWLHKKGLSKNSSSFYMRILRAVYNRAIEKDLTPDHRPFRHVYTGVDKTVKRAVPIRTIRQIKHLDLSENPFLDFARDTFLFSFYTRGMSFIDMAYLKKNDLHDGILSYRRHKTGQQLFIKWEKCMQEFIDKHTPDPAGPYLLPILKPPYGNRNQYKNMITRINKYLKVVARQAGLSVPLTLYVARHSWASIARNKNIPLSVISEGMGHDSEKTTQIYLASLDTSVVDRANSMILKEL